jgi:hypothetical protein
VVEGSRVRREVITPGRLQGAGRQLVDLCRQCHRFGGVALEYLDGDRTAVRGAQQTDHQLRSVAPMIAAVAVARQFAATSFQIGRGDIVEQQRAVPQVAPRQSCLDEVRFAAQLSRAWRKPPGR